MKRLLFIVRLEDTSPRSAHQCMFFNVLETLSQQPSDFCRVFFMFRQANKRQVSTQSILFIQHTTRYRRDHAGKKKKRKKIKKMTSGEKATDQNKNSRRSTVSCSLRLHTGTGVSY